MWKVGYACNEVEGTSKQQQQQLRLKQWLHLLVSLADTRGILTRFNFDVYSSLKVNTSSSAMFLPLLLFFNIRCFGVHRDIKWRLNSLFGICSSSNADKPIDSDLLNIMRIHI
jgi:hypothetical protein